MVRSAVEHTVKSEYGIIPDKTTAFDAFQEHVSVTNCATTNIDFTFFDMEFQLQCCGAQGPIDWAASKYNENATKSNDTGRKDYVYELGVINKKTSFNVPASCCTTGTARDICNKSLNFEYGVSKITKHPNINEKVSDINCSLLAGFHHFSFEFLNFQGCVEVLLEKVHENLTIILSVIIGIVAVEVFALLISLCLCCSISDKEDHYKS